MFIKVTDTFKPGDPKTHAKYSHSEKPLGEVYIIKTPEKELEPYNPKIHNDPSQKKGIRQGCTLLTMSYNKYWRHSIEKRRLDKQAKKDAKAARIPTQDEIDIFTSPVINAYLSLGFDPMKGDDNKKFDPRFADDLTEILVVSEKIHGGAYEPYIPSKHRDTPHKSTNLPNFKSARSKARRAYENWLAMGNVVRVIPPVSGNPTPPPTTSRQEVETFSTGTGFNLFPNKDKEQQHVLSKPSVANDVPSDKPKPFRPWE